jgi:DNA-binding NarL/FixJ family response regulator
VVSAVVCDEQLLFAEAFASALESHGLSARAVPSHAAALAVLADRWRSLLVLSVPAPDDAGVDLVRLVRAEHADVSVVCLVPSTAETARACSVAGADLLLSKRQPLAELVSVVAHASVRRGRAAQLPDRVRQGRGAGRRPVVEEPLAARFLSARERDVLCRLASAQSTAAIAASMGIAVTTVRGYVQSTFTKLGVHSRVEAVRYAIDHGLVELSAS